MCGRRMSVKQQTQLWQMVPSMVTFGDIWCLFVSFGPAPHIYQRGERVGGAVCTIHGHCPDYTWLSVR